MIVLKKLVQLKKLTIVSSSPEVEYEYADFLITLIKEMRELREVTYPNFIRVSDLIDNLKKRHRGIKLNLINQRTSYWEYVSVWRACP